MNDDGDDRIQRALRDALPRVDARGPARDLWPQLRLRFEAQRAPVTRLDWALLAALLGTILLFPESLLTLLYHL